MSLGEYLHMGGHAVYVWGSYGAALVILAVNVIHPLLRGRQLRRELKREIESGATR